MQLSEIQPKPLTALLQLNFCYQLQTALLPADTHLSCDSSVATTFYPTFVHYVNMFHSHGYILIIVIILHSAQKCRFYVNSLIAACKQEGAESKNNMHKVHHHRFPEVHMPSFSFLGSLVFELEH
jgi:hypothetical protein